MNNNLEEIKCILFDLDNTLIDRQMAAYLTYQAIIHEDFPDLSEEEILKIVSEIMVWDGEGHIDKELVFTPYIEKYGIQNKTWKTYHEIWPIELPKYTIEFPDSCEVLEYVKQKYRIGLVTNGSVESQSEKINHTDLARHFEMILIPAEIGLQKPDERVFLEACRRMDVKPEACIFIGDGLKTDIIGSSSVGMKTIWVHPDVKRTSDLPWQRIYRIKDLLEIL
jgi:haloacid dehalogenase superfamily, subfamily IA, variant 3 with third motif having DD or ED/haloacid dehalogenase superfamily, subfamily IA, variant 1 with third motif having Dx(3-4)D or Dx(3-4)E